MPQVASDTIDNTWERCQEKGSKAYGEELMLHVPHKYRAAIPLPLLLARVEEEFQAYKWGVVEGGHDIDRADLKVRLTAPMVYLRLRSDV